MRWNSLIASALFLIAGIFKIYAVIPYQDTTVMKQENFDYVAKLPMQDDHIIRLSKIEVYPQFLEEYIKFATEVGTISLKTEPGVITMYALSEKENPCMITILETYVSQDAYKSHINSPHFQIYKQSTLHMVKNWNLLTRHHLILQTG